MTSTKRNWLLPLRARSRRKSVQAQPDYPFPLCVLGVIDAALGRKEEALREGWRAVELLPVKKDAVDGKLLVMYLAIIASWAGEKGLACEQLALVTGTPGSPVSYGALKLNPLWDPLRGQPCFEKIVASLAPKGTSQPMFMDPGFQKLCEEKQP